MAQRRDNKVWPTLQLVNRSNAGSRNWWETKTRRSQIQHLRRQMNVVGMPPATLEAAGTLIVDVVCSAESADLTAATMEARPKRQRTARLECESDAMGSQTSFAEEGGTSGMAPVVKVGSRESSGKNRPQGCCLCYVETCCE